MIEIEVINSFEQLQGIEKEWKNLISMSKANSIFLTYEWIDIWWRHFGNKKKLFILVLRDDGSVVGIAPLMIVNSDLALPVRVVKFIGTEPQSNVSLFARTLGFGSRYGTVGYMDFILQEDHSESLISYIVNFWFKNVNSWDAIDLQGLNPSSNTHLILSRLLTATPLICAKRIPSNFYHLPLTGSVETYFNSLSKKTRSNLRRSRRRLESNGKLEFLNYGDIKKIKEMLPYIIKLEEKSWKGDKATGLFSGDQKTRRFHIELAKDFSDRGWFDLSLLIFKDEIIAYLCSFIYGGRCYEYGTAYDPDFSYYSPGMVLQHLVISKAFESKLKGIDFMAGFTPQKARLRLLAQDYIQLMIFKNGVYSKLLYTIEFKLKPCLKTLKNSVLKKKHKSG
ncbi:MAG: GNAT family N-acetyltransferase [Planctomycetota bacterium]